MPPLPWTRQPGPVTWASYTWVKSYQFCKLLFEDGFVVLLGSETLAPTPCEFRPLPLGLRAPLAQFGAEITAGPLTHLFSALLS